MTRFAQRYIINYGVPNLHSQIYGVCAAFIMFLKEMFADCNLTNSPVDRYRLIYFLHWVGQGHTVTDPEDTRWILQELFWSD